MIITAYDANAANPQPVILGSPIAEIWVNGWRGGQKRTIQVVKPIEAPAPNLFDRKIVMESFAFAAQRKFTGSDALALALVFLRTHPRTVPTLAHLNFNQDGQVTWLRNCGIDDIQIVKVNGASIGFSYSIIGGTDSLD